MEEYSNITRFCIICNYHNKIIDPLISRCSLFYFKPINDNDVFNKLKYICLCEKFNCSDYLINKIIKISKGDLRKAINFLQKCYNSSTDEENENLLNEISGIIPNKKFNELIDYIFLKDLQKIDSFINNLYNDGYSLVNQILLFHDFIINSNLDNSQKSNIITKISEIDQNLIKGCDEFIQFMRLVYFIISVI
jgi:replication factor C subunit 2/4